MAKRIPVNKIQLADNMRRAVLQAAIEGKLTEQYPATDGYARDLLANIEHEKQRLIKAGEIKRQKSLPPITEEEKPFNIPDNWEWVRLGELISVSSGQGLTKAQMIDEAKYPVYGGNGITGYFNDFLVEEGILIIGRVGFYCGATHKTISKSWVTDNALIVSKFSNNIDTDFLHSFLNHLDLKRYSVATAQPVISGQRISQLLLPLPPLEEQQRIIEKLQEVLPQIDSLQTDEDELHRLQLAFPNQIQASLLQAAIGGKLTQQNATKDGHASDLLADIEIEKQKLMEAGELKRQKSLPPITEEEKPFDIPDNWEWVRLGDVVIVNPRNKAEDNLEAAFVPMKLVEAGYKNTFNFEVRKWKSIKTGYTHFAENDVVFAKITPCFQNRKSTVISNIPNGIGAGTTEFHVLRSFTNHIDVEYLLYFVKNPTFINDGVATFTGTAGQQRIGTDFVKEYLFPLPPLAEQKRIVKLINQALPEVHTLKEI